MGLKSKEKRLAIRCFEPMTVLKNHPQQQIETLLLLTLLLNLKQSEVDLFTKKKKKKKKRKEENSCYWEKEYQNCKANIKYSPSRSIRPMSYAHKVRSVVPIQRTLEI